MKPEESHHEIGEHLRSQKPDIATPPGLEQRILQALDRHQRPAPRPWWPWLLLPPAFAALSLLLWPRPAAPVPEIAREPLPVAAPIEPAISLAGLGNPLSAETTALSRDARRAGNFLIDCLPSISSAGE
jgi:hypothetical protein